MKVLQAAMRKRAELQIAPLIDVVFLLLIYFMVTSSLIKKEADLSFLLPAGISHPVGIPVEVLVEVSATGDILVEGMRFDDQGSLARQLAALKASADLSESDLIVNILPADKALHGRVVAVMDACAAADVKNTSFAMSL